MNSEFSLIGRIAKKFSSKNRNLLTGIGDDCAVLAKDKRTVQLVTTDAVVQDVHFDLNTFSYADVGHKALAVNLSDIAAMGGSPRFYFVALAIPKGVTEKDILQIYAGMNALAQKYSVVLAGGNVSCASELSVTITVMGEAKRGEYKLRSGARVGDGVYVTGNLGNAALGLREQRRPTPQIALGKILARQKSVHAMIDLSDGLLQDLGHITTASKVAAVVNYEKIPRAKNFSKICNRLGVDERQILLAGGEDYELLFTMSDRWAENVSDAAAKIGKKIFRIGEIVVAKKGSYAVKIINELGDEIKITKKGYEHF